MDLPEFAIEAEGVVKIYPATKTAPEMHALDTIKTRTVRVSEIGCGGYRLASRWPARAQIDMASVGVNPQIRRHRSGWTYRAASR